MRALLREALGRPALLALALGSPLAAGAGAVVRAWFLARGIQAAFLEAAPPADLLPYAVGAAGSTAVLALARGLATAGGGALAAEVKAAVRQRLAARVAAAGPERLGEPPARVAMALSDAVEGLDGFFRGYLPALAEAAAVPLGILVLVAGFEPLSALVLLVTAPLIPLFMVLIGRWAEGVTARQWRALFALGAYFADALKGMATLRVFGAEGRARKTLERLAEDHRLATLRVLRVAFLSALVLELLATLSTAIVAVEVGLRLLAGRLGYLEAFFVLLLAPEYFGPLRALGAQFHPARSAQDAAATLARLNAAPLPRPAPACPPGTPPGLVLQGVRFRYPRGGGGLEGVDLAVGPGELVALVGPSGAGKSTLFKLVLGFLDPDAGTICLNRRPVRPDRFAYLPQTPFLFPGTLRENLLLASPQADRAALRRALERSGLDEVVARLPSGLETPVGEGGLGLSAGERQRLALARAFLKRPEAVLLDEPTAHLDEESEARVLAGILALRDEGVPVLAIAHRPALIGAADRVVRLERGRRLAGEAERAV